MTGRELLSKLLEMSDHTLDYYDLSVCARCDEQGDTEFFTLLDFHITDNHNPKWAVNKAADGILNSGSPILIHA